MGSNLAINDKIEEYINEHSLKLNSIQKEIITYNDTLGEIKKCKFQYLNVILHLIIKFQN